ncbi:hypothetical protein [Lysobacter gummosus]|uniref:hypothetical protein n=1 Tax=Lysobacter gummosus TaxID=262324 RepID=UPI003626A7F9
MAPTPPRGSAGTSESAAAATSKFSSTQAATIPARSRRPWRMNWLTLPQGSPPAIRVTSPRS